MYLQWQTNVKSYMIYRTAPFSVTLNDPNPVSRSRYYLSPNSSETAKDAAIVAMEDE